MRHWDWTMRYNSEHKTKTRERLLEEAAAAIKLEGQSGSALRQSWQGPASLTAASMRTSAQKKS
jgi:hypothetical protein